MYPTSARNQECTTEIQKLLKEDEIYNFASSYHAHSSPDADEKEECRKDEKQTDNFKNNCKGQRQCVILIKQSGVVVIL